jgi:hypothetical protein
MDFSNKIHVLSMILQVLVVVESPLMLLGGGGGSAKDLSGSEKHT